MNKQDKSILIALTIGDGHLNVRKDPRYKNSYNSAICFTHCIKQKPYLEWKVELLHKIFGGKLSKVTEFNNNGYPGVRSSKTNKYFRVLKKYLYNGKNKKYTRNILNWLTPQGLAIWYMDDGGLGFSKNENGNIRGRQLIINTHLSIEENQIIIDYFKEVWDINFTQVKNKNQYRLRCGAKEAEKFINIVRPYILPIFDYKINLRYT